MGRQLKINAYTSTLISGTSTALFTNAGASLTSGGTTTSFSEAVIGNGSNYVTIAITFASLADDFHGGKIIITPS